MPLPRWLGRLNRRVTNPILGRLLVFAPGFGHVVHRGRRSGRTYRTPVLSFRRGQRLVVALTYGPGADWVRNVLAAGRCGFETRRVRLDLAEPRRFRDPTRRPVPRPVRWALALLRVEEFLELRIEGV